MSKDTGSDSAASLGSVDEPCILPRKTIGEARLMRWISVEEKMPDRCDIVLVCGPDIPYCSKAWAYEKDRPWHDHFGLKYEKNSITHWMPLPARPSDGK
jgi:hypothetical protein